MNLSPDASGSSGPAWQRLIRRTRTRINFGWVADAMAPLWLIAGTVSCVLLLFLRSLDRLPAPARASFAGPLAAALLLLPALALLRSRRRFVSEEQACTRLDAHLQLHNALAAARGGLRAWPPAPPRDHARRLDGLRWNWRVLAVPPLLAALLIALPFLVPPPARESLPLPPNEPLAWETIEASLDRLSRERIADPSDIRDFQQRLDALRQTPPEEWFQNSNLEATDSLQESLERSLRQLEAALSRSSQALSALENPDGGLSPAEREALQTQLRQAQHALSTSDLAPPPALWDQLPQFESTALPADPAAARALRAALHRNTQVLRELLGQSDALRQQWERQLQADALFGKTASDGPGAVSGQGSPTRGPGEAPIYYAEEPVDLGTNAPERLSGLDPARAAPGDLLGMGAAKPVVEAQAPASQAAGSLEHAGQGGYEIWEASLLPSERALLQNYFR